MAEISKSVGEMRIKERPQNTESCSERQVMDNQFSLSVTLPSELKACRHKYQLKKDFFLITEEDTDLEENTSPLASLNYDTILLNSPKQMSMKIEPNKYVGSKFYRVPSNLIANWIRTKEGLSLWWLIKS